MDGKLGVFHFAQTGYLTETMACDDTNGEYIKVCKSQPQSTNIQRHH